ncbi:MAG: hypothetical protein Q4F66_04485 [Clostridium sp.]|nr:hypothetical protein [Clostridium sp.]
MSDESGMKKEIQIIDEDNNYSLAGIGLVLFFYLIMIFALFHITSLIHIYNYAIAFLFLLLNMASSIRVIGFGKYFRKRIHIGFYVGIITFTVLYTIANFAAWILIPITSMGTYSIINFLIVFLYLAAAYSTFSFGVKQSRK